VDTGSYLSFVDHEFCMKHNLLIVPLQAGESRSYTAAGQTRITAIGSTNLVLTFAGENFAHNFQIIKKLSTNILIGVNFTRKYNCVAYLSQGLFSLGDARVTVPLVVKGETLGLAKLKQQVTLQANTQQIVQIICPRIRDQSVFLLEPIMHKGGQGIWVPRTILANKGVHYCQLWNTTDEALTLGGGTFIGQLTPLKDIVSIAQENAPAAPRSNEQCYVTNNRDGVECRQTFGRNKHRRYAADRGRAPQSNFSRGNNRTDGRNNADRGEGFSQHDRGQDSDNDHHQTHIESPVIEPIVKHTYEELKICLTNPAITPEQQAKFRAFIDEFGDIFAVHNSELTGTDRLKFTINIQQDARPVRQRPYSYSQEARVEIERQIQEMLAIKFIRHSISPWASNKLLVRKKNNEQRFCIEYKALNRCIIPEVHAVPSFSSIHDTLSYAKPVIFSSLNLRASFHSLIVDKESIKYTAFQSHLGQFEYLCAPFGFKTIPSHLIRVMSLILAEKMVL